ncbi:hypothetical protein H0H87_002552 [Tephrocybe sp. NHM501043]|nr:hypothetical protein H0H87_002552 [Tephrocybe sp. NHM501043]
MSLISDTDYLIHGLRLSYLRDVEDVYGPRLITLDPSYNSNPFIIAASLADTERWPEISMPTSPQVSDDEAERPSGFPGARLKHTQTIMGGRSGGLGMRVHGKKASISRRMSGTPQDVEVKNFISKNALQDLSSSVPVTSSTPLVKSLPNEKFVEPASLNVHVQGPTAVEEAPVQKIVQFIPKFKGAAEMEARRRVRMAARRRPGGAAPAPLPPQNFDTDSSDEEIPLADDSSSDGDFGGEVDSMDEGDDFDFAFSGGQPTANSDSDALSIISVTSSDPTSPWPQTRPRATSRLSPVSEDQKASPDRARHKVVDSETFEMISPAPTRKPEVSGSQHRTPQPTVPPVDSIFAKKKVLATKPLKSALSSMLASADASANPFAETYAAISGRGESASVDVIVYFPNAVQPRGKPMELNVRKDATVEEVIGFSLWTYWKEGWKPALDEGLSGESDPQWETKVSAVGWIMRIAEEDGEVDDDFPRRPS